MKKGLFLLFVAFSLYTFTACTSDSSGSRLEQEKMAQVLADIHLDEAIIQNMHTGNSDTALVLYHALSKQTLKKHGLDSTQVAESIGSYLKDPAALVKLYTRVNKIIEEKRDKSSVKKP